MSEKQTVMGWMEFRDHMGEVSERSRFGRESFVITRHGKPWMELRPIAGQAFPADWDASKPFPLPLVRTRKR